MKKNRTLWSADGGESTLRIEFPGLSAHSVVLDCGGWKGDWSSDIYSKYRSKIYIFEPVPQFNQHILKRFSENNDIYVNDYGIGSHDTSLKIYLGSEGSSIFKNRNTTSSECEVSIVDVQGFIENSGIDSISLIKINIEGGEYDLIDRMIDCSYHHLTDRFLIQFHDFVPEAVSRRDKIRCKLKETHDLIFDYPFVWEYWRKKSL